MSRKAISISIEKKIINKIDTTKGKNEPRSRFIEDIICEFLKKNSPERLSNSQANTKKTNSQQKEVI